MTLQLSQREEQLYRLFQSKAKRPIAQLRSVYLTDDTKPIFHGSKGVDKCITSCIYVLNKKLKAAKKGSIVRVSPRGRGHVGVYQLKRR